MSAASGTLSVRAGAGEPLLRLARPVVGVAIFLIAAEALVSVLDLPVTTVPRPSVIAAEIARAPSTYAGAVWRTFLESFLGFVAGGIFGVATGVVFSRSRTLREMFLPLFVISQTIPVIAFGSIIVLWFGNTLLAKGVIAFYLSFFPVTVNTLIGFRAVDPQQVALMRSFGASEGQLLRRLFLPTALPQIFVALRLGAALSLVGAIVGEWFGDVTGLGVLLLQAMYNENYAALWAAIVLSAVLGLALYGLVALAERRIVFWGSEQ
ncbi:ABC transporter permease [Acuticoccus sediminis]|uniref:ABC transporter permease n=1 Tax=Acuticoccus sediminis TaxID=2184697 RepID=A0A8B2NV66_9HYPH|nr:ABC transporter permease [Acuticoccus sediminis]RAI02198.1 ABC transporter permease [Acuticoccus sediminis]